MQESGGAFDVRRADPDGGTVLDPSGVVKGWAVDRAARLDVLPETDFCLSAGGDLVCRTGMAGSPGWRIGVEDPQDPGRVLAVVPVRDRRGRHLRDWPTAGTHIRDGRSGGPPARA